METKGFPPLRTTGEPLAGQIYERLKEKIITAALKPGQALSETELAKSYNVSKSPVRDALNRLHTTGLVEIVPYKGFFVTSLSVEDAREALQVRLLLEGATAELAARHAKPHQVEQLSALARLEWNDPEGVPSGSRAEVTARNRQFHRLIAESSGNRLLCHLVDSVLDTVDRLIYLNLHHDLWTHEHRFHDRIAAAIAAREEVKAKEYMIAHLEDMNKRLLKWV